jgi:hypothetical protein
MRKRIIVATWLRTNNGFWSDKVVQSDADRVKKLLEKVAVNRTAIVLGQSQFNNMKMSVPPGFILHIVSDNPKQEDLLKLDYQDADVVFVLGGVGVLKAFVTGSGQLKPDFIVDRVFIGTGGTTGVGPLQELLVTRDNMYGCIIDNYRIDNVDLRVFVINYGSTEELPKYILRFNEAMKDE